MRHPDYPQIAFGEEEVLASLEVNTGLDELGHFQASLREASIAANEECHLTWEVTSSSNAPSVRVTIYVWKGGSNHGDAGDSAVTVSWMALGR